TATPGLCRRLRQPDASRLVEPTPCEIRHETIEYFGRARLAASEAGSGRGLRQRGEERCGARFERAVIGLIAGGDEQRHRTLYRQGPPTPEHVSMFVQFAGKLLAELRPARGPTAKPSLQLDAWRDALLPAIYCGIRFSAS